MRDHLKVALLTTAGSFGRELNSSPLPAGRQAGGKAGGKAGRAPGMKLRVICCIEIK